MEGMNKSNKSIIEREVLKLMDEMGDNSYLSENVMSRLKEKYKDQELLDAIHESFVDISTEQKNNAKRFAKKVLQKYSTNYPMHILLQKALKFKKKYGLSDPEFQIFKRTYERYILGQENISDRVKKYYTPHTNLTKTLGTSDRYGESMNYSAEDGKYLDQIMLHQTQYSSIHAHVALQSMTYPPNGFSLPSITGKVNRDRDNIVPGCSISPILAAMFIPKFKLFDDSMLLASISRIVKLRKNKKPINTMQDYELFYDLISDPNDIVCSTNSAMHDLLLRTQIQGSVWKSVTMLRYGKYFDCSSNDFDVAINNCKINSYNDTPDFLSVGDESSIVRRLLSTFALRPTVIKTTIMPMYNLSYPLRPEGSGIDIRVESAPLLTYRIGMNRTPQQPELNVKNVLRSEQFVYDREIRNVVPSTVEVIYSRNVFIVNIPRRNYRIDYKNLISPGATWHTLPRVFAGIDQANTMKVEIPEDIQIPEDSRDIFKLTSAIVIETGDLGEPKETNPTSAEYIVGYSAYLKISSNQTIEPLGLTDGEYFKYDPSSMFTKNVALDPYGRPNIPNTTADLYGLPIGRAVAPAGLKPINVLETRATILFYRAEDQQKQPDLGVWTVAM